MSTSQGSLKTKRELGITEVATAENSYHYMMEWDQEEKLEFLKLRRLEKGLEEMKRRCHVSLSWGCKEAVPTHVRKLFMGLSCCCGKELLCQDEAALVG